MRLVDLAPKLYRSGPSDGNEKLADADYLDFGCPNGCLGADGNPRRICIPLKPGRSDGWDRSGDSLDTLTLSPSIEVLGDHCRWHGFIRNGELVDA